MHLEFAESERAARAAGIIGAEVFIGKMVKGRVPPMDGQVQEVRGPGRRQRAQEKLPWRAQGASGGRRLRRLHREPDDDDVRLDRPKMRAHYSAQANREKVHSERMQRLSNRLKLLIFSGQMEDIVSQFVSQTVSRNSDRSSMRICDANSMTSAAIAA